MAPSLQGEVVDQMFPKLPILRSLIAESDKKSKSKTNLAITDRQIDKTSTQNLITWSHIQRIMRVTNTEARAWYLKEASEQTWDARTFPLKKNCG